MLVFVTYFPTARKRYTLPIFRHHNYGGRANDCCHAVEIVDWHCVSFPCNVYWLVSNVNTTRIVVYIVQLCFRWDPLQPNGYSLRQKKAVQEADCWSWAQKRTCSSKGLCYIHNSDSVWLMSFFCCSWLQWWEVKSQWRMRVDCPLTLSSWPTSLKTVRTKLLLCRQKLCKKMPRGRSTEWEIIWVYSSHTVRVTPVLQLENIRRKHNYLPLIVEVLKVLAKRGELVKLCEQVCSTYWWLYNCELRKISGKEEEGWTICKEERCSANTNCSAIMTFKGMRMRYQTV